MSAAPAFPDWSSRLPLTVGIGALVLLLGVLGVWSLSAQLAGAVLAQGALEVEAKRQVVQHPDGGVVGAILVRPSDTVQKGDVLIRLDDQRLQSELAIVDRQLHEMGTRKVRLQAERYDSDTLSFPPILIAAAARHEEAAQILAGEQGLFEARRETLRQEVSLLQEQNSQIRNRIDGIDAQLSALEDQKTLLNTELVGKQRLLDEQLTQASVVSNLQRAISELRGQSGRLTSEAAEMRGRIAGNEIEILRLQTVRREEAVTTLRDLQFREIELIERRNDLLERLANLEIRAPMSGSIYDMQVFTVKSVIRAAEPLLYIVPQDQPLVVTAQIESMNIDEVYTGQAATLIFSAFDQKKTPEITGEVARISADVIRDERTGRTFYQVELRPDAESLKALGDRDLVPGMPVEVFMRTGNRTPMSYLLEPFAAFFHRALRE